MVVETSIPESAIEAFDIGVLRGLAWLDERQPYPAGMSSCIECQAGEFRSMIDPDRLWQRSMLCKETGSDTIIFPGLFEPVACTQPPAEKGQMENRVNNVRE